MEIIDQLTTIVGSHGVLVGGNLVAYEQDWRSRAKGKCLAVVFPHSTQEVVDLVNFCTYHHIAIIPQGGNTGLVLGALPDSTGQQLILNLQKLKAFRGFSKTDLSIIVEGGCTLKEVQDFVACHDLLFPLSLASEDSCTIGGNLATNAGGVQVMRYGNARELCLGLEVVTPEGKVLNNLNSLKKDNTGYDWKNIYIGSEGTLGIITAAKLKLFTQPSATLCTWMVTHRFSSLITLLQQSQMYWGNRVVAFEVMNRTAIELVKKHFPHLNIPFQGNHDWHLLCEIHSYESYQQTQEQLQTFCLPLLENKEIDDIAISNSYQQTTQLWKIRESIPIAQSKQGLNIKNDIGLPLENMESFLLNMEALLNKQLPGIGYVVFGHLGDGNLHYNLQCPQSMSPQDFLSQYEKSLTTLVSDKVFELQGTFSAEHGIGMLKKTDLVRYKDSVVFDWMVKMKKHLDPQNLFNPGKMVDIF